MIYHLPSLATWKLGLYLAAFFLAMLHAEAFLSKESLQVRRP